jgi:capsular polysaccharide biosynthesis protein
MDINYEIDLKEYLETLLRDWWLIVGIAVMGGLLGLAFSFIHKPLYEAHSVLIVGSDFTTINSNSWTDSKTDYVNNKSAQIANSTGILNQVIDDFKKRGIVVGREAFSLDRRASTWDLVVQYPDAQVAADLANAWLDVTYLKLQEAHQNSLEVLEISQKLNMLQECTKHATSNSFCDTITNFDQLSQEIINLTAQLEAKERNSQGITAVITFEKGNRAEPPSRTVVNNRNVLVLIGVVLGLLIGSQFIIFRRRIVAWRHG